MKCFAPFAIRKCSFFHMFLRSVSWLQLIFDECQQTRCCLRNFTPQFVTFNLSLSYAPQRRMTLCSVNNNNKWFAAKCHGWNELKAGRIELWRVEQRKNRHHCVREKLTTEKLKRPSHRHSRCAPQHHSAGEKKNNYFSPLDFLSSLQGSALSQFRTKELLRFLWAFVCLTGTTNNTNWTSVLYTTKVGHSCIMLMSKCFPQLSMRRSFIVKRTLVEPICGLEHFCAFYHKWHFSFVGRVPATE